MASQQISLLPLFENFGSKGLPVKSISKPTKIDPNSLIGQLHANIKRAIVQKIAPHQYLQHHIQLLKVEYLGQNFLNVELLICTSNQNYIPFRSIRILELNSGFIKLFV